ncbi:hypothetical protein LJ655_11000 [Paraburkholderia sp. MMS20-SJTN17]|uniref:Uncharacterized protein n=1 Tax=Paraburkholderia translucens TaxID=2886945 RepID=A0ABS8KCD5_9BURK|nr:hypothetical protein [Paraburkholderia sp. MMS20-SJTN17]
MIKVPVAAGILVLASLIAHAEEVKVAMNFLHARNLLIHKGWYPVQSTMPGEHIGIENILVRDGIKEVESCAIDRPSCIFNYSKNNKCLRLVTFGENVPTMKIIDISNSCPS